MSNRFDIAGTPLDGLIRIERKRLGDERGWFERMFCGDELLGAGWVWPIAQVNRSLTSRRGTVRGMHFQRAPHAEAKFVSCLAGEVFDVAVDLREGSATYGRWHGEILSADNARSLFIPQGFAHGFQTLSENVEMLYFHSKAYAAEAEDGVRPNDPVLAIAWPLPISEMSPRDHGHKLLRERN
ncbi:MAG TPA: dTDP-4-dehydrorhamnose 3,5-epimerase [Parvibaculum sp.]